MVAWRRKPDQKFQGQRAADWPTIDHVDLPAGCTRFERVRVGPKTRGTECIDPKRGGLWIRQRGMDRTELVCSGVVMPQGFARKEASSLNHACTLLSERHEVHRISHTLNVYQHVFYLEGAGQRPRWRPLNALRSGVIADMERSILADAWRELEEKLGFRPFRSAEANPRRRKR